jgi:ubiquinone biosynthesis protein
MWDAVSDYLRLARAGSVMIAHDVVLPRDLRAHAPWPAKVWGGLLRAADPGSYGAKRPGQRFARALEQLGPAWIKLGQLLATRPDVIGVAAATDLSRLKDALAPFPTRLAMLALTAEFGESAGALFPALGEPVAAASVAQVHRLRLKSGERAVKILRPGVERLIERELRAMRRLARTAQKRGDSEMRRMEPVALVDTMGQSLQREMDLRLEAAACSEFAGVAAKDGFFHVPSVDWERTSRRVLATDWIDGRSLTDPAALNGQDRVDLANRITRGFLASALDHGFFHADLHEGNMILGRDGRLWLVDFGIMGRIGSAERRFLAEILAGFLARDYQRVARVHFEAGYVPKSHTVEDFALALRSVGEPIFGKSADQVAMSRLLVQLFDITRQFGMHLRPELILLQKTMVQVEGVARSIDPTHDIWAAARPIVERWSRREFGPEGVMRSAVGLAQETLVRLRRLPETLDRLEAVSQPPAAPPPRKGPPPWVGWLGGAALGAALVGTAWAWQALT